MGHGMAGSLLKAGFRVRVWNRTARRMDEIVAEAIRKKSLTLIAAAIALTFVAKGADAIWVAPQTQVFLNTLAAAGGPPIYTFTPDEARKGLYEFRLHAVQRPATLRPLCEEPGLEGSRCEPRCH
jgi:6-phosphogluconate dehydrogenase-like protein